MKKLFLFAALIALLVSCGGNVTPAVTDPAADTTSADQITEEPIVDMKTAYIHKISELNTESERDSRGSEYASAGLASNFREYFTLEPSFLKTEVAFYPRVKQISDGTFILFYQNGNHGPDIYYCLSADGFNYETPQVLFKGTTDKLYSTCDALVLKNGDILAIASYRLASNYLRYPMQSGIVIKRSTDNGKTWSNEQVIFRGCNWEPSLLQLESGEIQAYWTNTTGLSTGEGTFTSTGTAIVRSYDNGYTWTGDTSVPYSGQVVTKQATEVIDGVQFYTDQMPVAVELQNGMIALALESRLDRNNTYRITMSYSSDNWAETIAPDAEGPADKFTNKFVGTAPYIAQFASGEVILRYSRLDTSTLLLADPTGHKFSPQTVKLENMRGWGNIELIDNGHTALVCSTARYNEGETEEKHLINLQKVNLNHSLTIGRHDVTVDGNGSEWEENRDAAFVGSDSQAQMSVRFSHCEAGLGVLIDRLDYDLTSEDYSSIKLSLPDSRFNYLEIKVYADGRCEATRKYDGVMTEVKIEECAVTLFGTLDDSSDKDEGFLAELIIPAELLPEELAVYPILYNKDADGKGVTDKPGMMNENINTEWIKLK